MNHDYKNCKIDDCEECQSLIDNGLIIVCDGCDMPGDANSDSFTLIHDGSTLCSNCIKLAGFAVCPDKYAR